MWPFTRGKPGSPQAPLPRQPSRNAGKPVNLLLESYVLDLIGHLPADKSEGLAQMAPKLRQALSTQAREWRGMLRETLHLSDTFEVAVLDLWIRNGEIAATAGSLLDPEDFAEMFVEQYSVDGSRVDVWPGNSLALARERIAAWRTRRPDA
ncbi:MAG: hypothetical protein JWM27_3373 [Gemmatimonadetes bacterium]|nr:hypothetical protein [Gemmatimonadota bacterium]